MADFQPTLSIIEEWRDIQGWEGCYQVSSQGRVRSVDRKTTDIRGRNFNFRGKILAQKTPANGYKEVTLSSVKTGKVSKVVHRLVLEAFVGPRPEGMEACHWNDISGDNRLENLRWGTKSENAADMVRNTITCRRGHPFTPGNTYITPSTGSRTCRTCKRARRRAENLREKSRKK